MRKSAESILDLYDGKRREGFTGGIKIGFEQGRPVNCSEYSNPEQDPPPVPKGFNPEDRIKKACTDGYYGSLLFIFKDGEITHFSYVRTWAGKGIEELFSGQAVKSVSFPAGVPHAKLPAVR
jgi:hypothetical protein